MIIDCAVYRKGRRVAETTSSDELDDLVTSMAENDDFIWVGIHDPTQEEFDRIGKALDLHPLAIEDAIHAHQRPKIEPYSGHLFIVLKTVWYTDESDAVDTGEINAFLGSNYLVTVRHGKGQALAAVRHAAEFKHELLGQGPAAAFYTIVDAVVDQYEKVAADLEVDVDEVESAVFSSTRAANSDRIYRLKREILEFRRAVIPMRDPLLNFTDGRFRDVRPVAMPFFRDVVDHLVRVSDTIDSIDKLLDNALDAHMARLSVQQNDDMRKLAAYAAMFAAPTLIAGVYGMNFTNMPELGWRYGYGLCLLVMVAVVLVLWRAFKRSGWL
ncbi:magnesium/cobalt transporter CorA [Solicola gregarius]|uniref:Magnesium transport protein CorA n=1 Tax=Solicola gregarius TaxID=2908642 RepID=A0AA46TGN3_9ACTN|nr:magnesium/cobalt transporter CorA [Solicola gregarius]UYM05019.1 magnesium/cobalt transporter CorA [Solicola gregarius]